MRGVPPKVTVLALAYNHSDYLTETLDSIRRQTFQDFELFISDDASTDDSAQVIVNWNERHQRADRLFLHDRNLGLCPTLEELLGCATGEYLQFISCDDHLLPHALEERVCVLDRSGSEVAAVYSDALIMDDEGREQPTTFLQKFLKQKPAPSGDLYSKFLMGNFIPATTVLSKRAIVEKVGGFDASLAFEDWDLWLRLSREHDFAWTGRPAARYRIHAGNMHRTLDHQSRQFYRILAKHKDVLRARLRILLTLVRNSAEFGSDTEELKDFLSWADDYRDTRWFRKRFFNSGTLMQAAVSKVVERTEGFMRPFSTSSRQTRIRRAA